MEHYFDTREAASTAAAEKIAKRLSVRLDSQKNASLVVSGGTTPQRCMDELAKTELDWDNVHVLLSDERWVPPSDADSNERLVREHLLHNGASNAQILSMHVSDTDIVARAAELDQSIRLLPFPFACVLLGMGEDGHFASLFPDADNLELGLESDSSTLVIPVNTASSPHPRISLTLTALSRCDEIVLLIFGEKKREVYEQAKETGNNYPVAHLIKQKRAPVRVYWAP